MPLAIVLWLRLDIYQRCVRSIHDWNTFGVVLILGLVQTAIAYDGGYLAIRGAEDKLGQARKRLQLLLWGILGLGLLLLTAFVGVLNDRSQFHSDQQTQRAEAREQRLQQSLNQESLAVGAAYSELEELKESLNKPDESKDLSRRLAAIENYLTRSVSLSVGTTNPQLSPSPNIAPQGTSIMPLPLESNRQLKGETIQVIGKLHSDADSLEDAAEAVDRFRSQFPPGTASRTPEIRQAADNALLNFTKLQAQILKEDPPLAESYRRELLRRLPQEKVVEFPSVQTDVASIHRFLVAAFAYLDTLARDLPDKP